MRGRRSLRVASVVLFALMPVACLGGDAVADSPHKYGWWHRIQGTTPVFTMPPPPGSVPGGLTVGRDALGVLALAAVYFETPVSGADTSLYLSVEDDTGAVLPPGAVLRACPATSPWQGTTNGNWSQRPGYATEECIPASPVAAGKGFLWFLPGSTQVDGAFDLVIVPDGGQVPYTVNFAPPGPGTFVVDEVPPPDPETTTTTESTTTTTTTEPVVTTEETDPFITYEVGGGRGGTGTGAPVVTTAPPRPRVQPTTLVAFGPPSMPDFVPIPDTRGERIFAVSLLFFMAVALWWLGGNPARMPRLIGALAADGRAGRPAPAPERGVGRFARPRAISVRPPRL